MTSGDGTAADAALAAAKPEDSSAKAAAATGKADAEEDGKKEDAKPVEKRKRHYRVDTDLLRAFRYFDRTGAMLRQSSATSGLDRQRRFGCCLLVAPPHQTLFVNAPHRRHVWAELLSRAMHRSGLHQAG